MLKKFFCTLLFAILLMSIGYSQITATYIYKSVYEEDKNSLLATSITVNFRPGKIEMLWYWVYTIAHCNIPTRNERLSKPLHFKTTFQVKQKGYEYNLDSLPAHYVPFLGGKPCKITLDKNRITLKVKDFPPVVYERSFFLKEANYCNKYMRIDTSANAEFLTVSEHSDGIAIAYSTSKNPKSVINLPLDSVAGWVYTALANNSLHITTRFPDKPDILFNGILGMISGGSFGFMFSTEQIFYDWGKFFFKIAPLDSMQTYIPNVNTCNSFRSDKENIEFTIVVENKNQVDVYWSKKGQPTVKTQAYGVNNENGYFSFSIPGDGDYLFQYCSGGLGPISLLLDLKRKRFVSVGCF